MKKILKYLLLYERFEIKTKLTTEEIYRRLETSPHFYGDEYTGKFSEEGFVIKKRLRKIHFGGRSQNSFAPVLTAKFGTDNGLTTISATLRMNLFVQIVFTPIYLLSLICIFAVPVVFPIMFLMVYFGFIRPSEKMKENLISDFKE